jgi:small multidrug resistance pump
MPAGLILALAILAEVGGTLALRATDGLTRWLPIGAVIVGYGLAFAGMALVLKRMEVGVVYAIWSGAGTALVAAIGMAVLGEAATALKLASLALIIAGVVGLGLGGAH